MFSSENGKLVDTIDCSYTSVLIKDSLATYSEVKNFLMSGDIVCVSALVYHIDKSIPLSAPQVKPNAPRISVNTVNRCGGNGVCSSADGNDPQAGICIHLAYSNGALVSIHWLPHVQCGVNITNGGSVAVTATHYPLADSLNSVSVLYSQTTEAPRGSVECPVYRAEWLPANQALLLFASAVPKKAPSSLFSRLSSTPLQSVGHTEMHVVTCYRCRSLVGDKTVSDISRNAWVPLFELQLPQYLLHPNLHNFYPKLVGQTPSSTTIFGSLVDAVAGSSTNGSINTESVIIEAVCNPTERYIIWKTLIYVRLCYDFIFV